MSFAQKTQSRNIFFFSSKKIFQFFNQPLKYARFLCAVCSLWLLYLLLKIRRKNHYNKCHLDKSHIASKVASPHFNNIFKRCKSCRCSTLGQAPGLSDKHQNRLESFARDKHSSLLRKSVNYGCKMFCSTGPRLKSTRLDFFIQVKFTVHTNLIIE